MVGNQFGRDNVTWVVDDKKSYYGREININIHLDSSYSFDIMGRKVQCKITKRKRLSGYGDKSKLRESA